MQGLIDRQLASWPEAARRYSDLREVKTKEITIGGMPVRVQYNPARAVSTLARTDAASIAARPCFLCRENRPQQQESMPFEGCDGRRYEILVNPFPIFPEHFTVPAVDHVPHFPGAFYRTGRRPRAAEDCRTLPRHAPPRRYILRHDSLLQRT